MVDRGAHGIDILLDIAARKNVILLRGNHDVAAAYILTVLLDPDSKTRHTPGFMQLMAHWRSDGGEPTLQGYLKQSEKAQCTVMRTLRRTHWQTEVRAGGKCYHLSHTLPEYGIWISGPVTITDFILGEPDYEMVYDENKYFVTGHTPTGLIDSARGGRIVRMNHHIAIDCGAVFGNPLGCICLETGEEYYV